jgi:eukaryotic-like serine/threonine-protein kinase
MAEDRDETERRDERQTVPLDPPPLDDAPSNPTSPDSPLSVDPGTVAAGKPTVPAETTLASDGRPFGSSPDQSNWFGGRLEPGQAVFDKYVVIKLLGQGGMGTVWLVKHLDLDIERALKMIVSGIATDGEARARLKREARVMALFSHPNAVAVHDARMTHDAAFIEMEYVRGQCISAFMQPGVPMSIEWTTRILVQLCDVLQVAHDHGIVHRDLKPSNLMLVDDRPPGQEFLKVLDFGIAKLLGADPWDHDDVRTRTGLFIGTAPYSSPDQASRGEVDGRSDLYSVGVMLYEFLTGYRPFSGPSTIYDHLHTPPPPFAVKNPEAQAPPELERLVMRCLEKNPQDRPQSARELAEELLRAVGPSAVTWPSHEAVHSSKRAEDVPNDPRLQATAQHVESTVPLPKTLPFEGGSAPPRARSNRKWLIPAALGMMLAAGLMIIAPRFDSSTRTSTNPNTPKPGVPTGSPKLTVRPEPASFPPDDYEAEADTERINGLPRVLVRKQDQARFILIEGGGFMMGAWTRDDPEISKAELPTHPVRLTSYYLQETEVTNGEMRRFFRSKNLGKSEWPQYWREAWETLVAALNSSESGPDRYPAVGISHSMAEEYAASVGGRLPTEAEWEFAARSRGKERRYVWGNDPEPRTSLANIDTLGDRDPLTTAPVHEYSDDKTEQGIFDMTGNVREWCFDFWTTYNPMSDPIVNPKPRTSTEGQPFVIRGGSFATDLGPARTTFRSEPEKGYYTKSDLGFRVVIEAPSDRRLQQDP